MLYVVRQRVIRNSRPRALRVAVSWRRGARPVSRAPAVVVVSARRALAPLTSTVIPSRQAPRSQTSGLFSLVLRDTLCNRNSASPCARPTEPVHLRRNPSTLCEQVAALHNSIHDSSRAGNAANLRCISVAFFFPRCHAIAWRIAR